MRLLKSYIVEMFIIWVTAPCDLLLQVGYVEKRRPTWSPCLKTRLHQTVGTSFRNSSRKTFHFHHKSSGNYEILRLVCRRMEKKTWKICPFFYLRQLQLMFIATMSYDILIKLHNVVMYKNIENFTIQCLMKSDTMSKSWNMPAGVEPQ